MKFVILILWITSLNLSAQISQPLRYEREHRNSDQEYLVISMKEKGIALVGETKKYENNKKLWEIIFLDTAMVETWTTKIEVEHKMNILGHDYRDGNIYLIFQEPESASRSVNITEIIPGHKLFKQHVFKPEVNIHLTHFSVLESTAVFGGYINKEPTLLMYHLKDEKARIIPGVIQPNVELIDLRMNVNETFNALFLEKQSSRTKKLVVRTYDANGVLIVDDVIKIEEGKTIVEAITSTLVRDEMLVVGTWTYGNAKVAAGIFSVVVDPFQDQKVNYYDFPMLNHFLDGLKPKRAAKIKAKADWRRSVGKPVEYRMNVFPVRIEETKTGFCFLGEAYEVSTNSSRNMGYYPYSPYGYSPYGYSPYGYPYGYNSMRYRYPYNPYGPYSGTGPNTYVSEVRMKDAALVFFDGRGNMVSDLSLHFPEIKLTAKEQVSDFITRNGTTTIACKTEKEIVLKVADQNGAPAKDEKITPELKYPGEVIRSEQEDNTSIRSWYGPYFFVYGYQTVRNVSTKNSRDVFYINKVKVD